MQMSIIVFILLYGDSLKLKNNYKNMLDQKIQEFNKAMQRYNNNIFYNKLGIFVAFGVVALQFFCLIKLLMGFSYSGMPQIFSLFFIFILAFVFTDFINGIVHMIIDNSTNYTSIVGPLIAAFHLHHKQPIYRTMHPLKVYFYESGAKNWLLIYLLVLVFLEHKSVCSWETNFFLVSVAILSSLAELSHYWCHNAKKKNTIISKLQKYGILLSKDHHKHHHMSDNINYAFLNGMSDPLINIIASYLFNGYKNNADLHGLAYDGVQTKNRS